MRRIENILIAVFMPLTLLAAALQLAIDIVALLRNVIDVEILCKTAGGAGIILSFIAMPAMILKDRTEYATNNEPNPLIDTVVLIQILPALAALLFAMHSEYVLNAIDSTSTAEIIARSIVAVIALIATLTVYYERKEAVDAVFDCHHRTSARDYNFPPI
jgi:hypothetical protein